MTARYTVRIAQKLNTWNFSNLGFDETIREILLTTTAMRSDVESLVKSAEPDGEGQALLFGNFHIYVAAEDIPLTAEEKVAALKEFFRAPSPKNSFYINGFPDQYETLNEFMDTDYGTKIKKILEGE